MQNENSALEDTEKYPGYGTSIENGTKSPPEDQEDPLKATIGNFGRWQLKISVLMSLLKFPIAWFTLSIVFLAPPTQFWCKQPPKYASWSDAKWIEASVPNETFSLKQEGLNTGYCTMVELDNDPSEIVPCEYGYSYNRSIFKSSIVTEWDLVCGHQRLIDLTQMTLMLGILTGNIFFGILADRRGRKAVLITCIILQSFFGILASWIPWYWGFIICRFLLAICNGGTMVTSFVMCMEIVGGKWRTIVPILYQIPFGFGNSIMAGLAFFLRDWRWFHFTLALLSSLYIFYIWGFPESPRWLLAVGRKDEAIAILQKAAVTNHMDPAKVEIAFTDLSNISHTEQNKSSFGALFSTKELKKRSCLLYLNWGICGIFFYAFSQYLGHVGSNIYLTVATSGFIALPGTLLCVYLVNRCGRRYTITTAHLVTATCCLAILFIPKGAVAYDWPRVMFAAIGLIGISVSMPALYLFTGELYPTVLRNAGVGASVMFSRMGSMLAPLIIALEEVKPYLPLLVLSIAALLEAILVLPLPETKGLKLPETIQDLDNNVVDVDVKENNGRYRSISLDQLGKTTE